MTTNRRWGKRKARWAVDGCVKGRASSKQTRERDERARLTHLGVFRTLQRGAAEGALFWSSRGRWTLRLWLVGREGRRDAGTQGFASEARGTRTGEDVGTGSSKRRGIKEGTAMVVAANCGCYQRRWASTAVRSRRGARNRSVAMDGGRRWSTRRELLNCEVGFSPSRNAGVTVE